MRSIRRTSIATFAALLTVVLSAAASTAWWVAAHCPGIGEFRSIVAVGLMVTCTYVYAIATHHLIHEIVPLREGAISEGNSQEFRYDIYVLFYVTLFNSLIRSKILPVALMRLVYLALGARLGKNTYSAGVIFDPRFVNIGTDTLIGESALLVPHVIEGADVAHYTIVIGNNVIIGARSVVMAGARIGDDVVIAVNSVVTKGCCIPDGEVWGGTPARRISRHFKHASPPEKYGS